MPASDGGDAQPPALIDPRDLTVRVDTAGGPGGQHANRTRSRVTVELDLRTASLDDQTRERLRAVFGDVVRATSSASRRQGENRRLAEERLRRRVALALDVPALRRKATLLGGARRSSGCGATPTTSEPRPASSRAGSAGRQR